MKEDFMKEDYYSIKIRVTFYNNKEFWATIT